MLASSRKTVPMVANIMLGKEQFNATKVMLGCFKAACILQWYAFWYCCDRKSRAACAQSFAPWQQATIEIMLAISLSIACSCYIYNGVILHAHPLRGESHSQRNATGEVASTSSPFYNEPHRSHVLCVKAELGMTSTSWSQHHFVAIGNPERHVCKASHRGSKQQYRSFSQSLLLLLARATYIMVLFFTHIPFVVNHTINATLPERMQQYESDRSVPMKRKIYAALQWINVRHGVFSLSH